MGSILRLPTAETDLEPLLDRLTGDGIRTVGTAAREGRSLHDARLDGPLALLFGGEGAGLDAGIKQRLDEIVHVPMHRAVESLSVGAAAAVVMFEAARQREARRQDGR